MNFRDFEIRVERSIVRNSYDIWLIKWERDGTAISYIENFIMRRREVTPGTAPTYDENPPMAFSLSEDLAQNLMDELWTAGIRPTEGTGSAGSLKATENHLNDMQKLSWKLLNMVEKDKEKDKEKGEK